MDGIADIASGSYINIEDPGYSSEIVTHDGATFYEVRVIYLKMSVTILIKFGIEMLVMRTSKTSDLHPHRTEFYQHAVRGRLNQLEKLITKSEYISDWTSSE